MAAEQYVWNHLKINYSAHVHRNERTCHPVQQLSSLAHRNKTYKAGFVDKKKKKLDTTSLILNLV